MATIRVNGVKSVIAGSDRTTTVTVEDSVRGEVAIRFSEEDIRWIWASFADVIQGWRREDGEVE